MIDRDALTELLPGYLARQAWFAHGSARAAVAAGRHPMVRVALRQFEVWRDNGQGLVWAVVDAELDGRNVGAYQVLVGLRPAVPLPAFLVGATSRLIGTVPDPDTETGELIAYDALVDPDATMAALRVMFEDLRELRTVRKLTVGKTSTSVVADERWLCKVFRRVHDGSNPGVEMPEALWANGFRATLETVESWRPGEVDLALRRPFLPGAANGFDFASASLRELLASGLDPDQSPGDFSPEARRLGEMVADMHRASIAAFGTNAMARDEFLGTLVDAIIKMDIAGLDNGLVTRWHERIRVLLPTRLLTLRDHGNLHLGQLLRSDLGWLILDFEGAPLMPVDQRRIPRVAWFDVGSILRSFDYVVAFTLASRADSSSNEQATMAKTQRWVMRNTRAFLDGYLRGAPGPILDDVEVDSGVDAEPCVEVGQVARALYEVAYERANRPDNETIPQHALIRLVEKGANAA